MIVIKLGGRTFETEEGRDRLLGEIASLVRSGRKIVLVHGGGARITSELAAAGVEARFVRGLRVTDAETLAVVERVLRANGLEIADALERHKVVAAAVRGNDGPVVLAEKRAELGLVGRVVRVQPEPLLSLLRDGIVPVVSPLGASADAPALNVNADEVAGALAAGLPASELLLLTDVDNVVGPEGPLPSITVAKARDLLANGTAKDGMAPKLEAALVAAAEGCIVTIANGNRRGVVEAALAHVVGTRVV